MSGPPSGPPLSPDGRYYWDGEKWVPVPQQRRKAGSTGFGAAFGVGTGLFAGGCLVFLVVAVAALLLLAVCVAAIGGSR
jgi:hypothetical protein